MVKKNSKEKLIRRIKRQMARHLYLTRFLFLTLLIGLLFLVFSFILPTAGRWLGRVFQETSFLKTASPEDLKSTDGRVNLLLLGMGGSNHKGADLTDTIIFFSIDLAGEDVLMFSLPRDIWIPSMRAKINTAYHYGEEKQPGGGLILARSAVSEILNQPVHYVLLVDFDAFVKMVDLLEGIEIDVERSFDDFKYPIPGKENAEPEEDRYEHLHFDAGNQLMDGSRALKYVRSRYAEGEEGTDFARSKRQQRLVLSLKQKIFSTETLLNPKRIPELVAIFADHLKTDITEEDWLPFFKLTIKFKQQNLRTEILDGGTEGSEGYLVNPPQEKRYDYQWVLVPRTGDWQEVQEYVANLLI